MGFSLDLRYQICLQPIELPVFNSVALELLQLLANADAEINNMIEIINKDQALTLQILKMANSPVYAGRYKSETIKESVSRLGVAQITSLAMAASQAALHVSPVPVVNEAMHHLWLHSHACAVGCRSLAIGTGYQPLADQAYLAGLLHDIGKLYLLKALEQICVKSGTTAAIDRETLLDVFSDMHVEQGYRIMHHWDIPPLYCNIVAHHHTDTFDPPDVILAMVRLINFQSRVFELDAYPRFIQPDDVLPEMGVLSVTEAVAAQVEKAMRGSCA